jgi:release factor glutamine methyltransferase
MTTPTVATRISPLLEQATREIAESGFPTPRLDADLIMCGVLNVNRSRLFALLQDELDVVDAALFQSLVERRKRGEPVAYLTGIREFMVGPIGVTPDVLVPRPETELLVQWAIEWLKTRPNAKVVDVGTGSGAIAIAIATLAPPDAVRTILATDISPRACDVARDNIEALALDNVRVQQHDLLYGLGVIPDLVLANLPYLTPEQIDGNPDLAMEPRRALDGGTDGLDLIRRLISQLPKGMSKTGAVALEIDPSQAETVATLLRETLPDAHVVVHPDLAGLDRFVTAERGSGQGR